ncbi:MAG: AAA family ATPase, partial [Blastocatellia bacterium]|nr:AAA family ATPase [Blastocatellia bacterium]
PKERYSTAIELVQTLTDAATRAKPIFVPKQNFEEPPPLPEVRVTGTYYAASTWRGVAGTLNLEVCVGREKEIERLRESFGKVAQGRGDAILITAEPGVGKSFLLHEYQKWVEAEGAIVLPARFYDYGGSQLAPYQVFLDTLRACLMGERTAPITQRIDVELLKQQFEKGKTEELVEIIQYKTGVILPGEAFSAEALAGESDKWRVFESLLEIYKRMARSAPVVFLFDDLHFADSLSLELIAYIVRNSSSTRFQVVATALAEEAKATGKVLRGWLTKQIGYSNYSEIALQGIARENAENFLTAIFGSVKVSDRDLDYLWNETQGFPFYLVELIEHLMISKKIDKSGDTWKVTGFGQFEVPPSANNLVNAKLRSFNQTSLNVLKHAAVIGEEFYFDTLADVVGMDEDELDIVVRDSVSGWVLKQQQSALGDFFRFHHGMMRRALYNSLTLFERRKIHAKVAKAIEEGQSTRKDRIAGQIAYHYYMGGIWESAVEPGIRAGELARKREAFSESVTYYCYASEAIEQQKSDVQNEGKLRIGLSEALIHLSRFEEAEKEIAKLFELASRKLDIRLRAWGEFLASRLNHSRGNFKRAVELAQLGIESVEELISYGQSDNELYRRLLQQCGYTLFMTGRLDEACEPLEKAVAVVEATGDPRPSGWALSFLGLINCYRGNGTKGLQLGEKGLKLLRASGDRVSELLAWERVGIVCGMLGDKDRAIYFFENGMELARTIGYKVQESRLLVNLGEAYRLKADYKEAEVYYNQALPIARQIEQEDVEALCLQNLGLV